MKKVLITGITGFVGSHLAELLLSKNDYQVFGTARPRSNTENISHLLDKIKIFSADILDSHSIYTLIKKVQPDYIFHLAAQSFVPASWTSPATTMEANVLGSVNLFEAIRKSDFDPVIQIACSSEEYGLVKKSELPVNEDNPFRPLSPYAVSKVAMDLLGYQYFKSYGMKIIRTRAFNHTGPRRTESFVSSNFARQIAEIEKGLRKPVLKVGNLEAKRDFTDVRDVVRAYLLAVQKARPGEAYVIASGKTWQIKKVLEMLLGMSNIKVKIEQDPERMRPSDVPVLQGDSTKFRKATGWIPQIPFEKTLRDTLDYWRARM
ncbi:MAG TPA: GDP-mannose 4,6-dehydratase [Candidatus Bathyarchaeia archaeon]|nr:GDP-mannose 4,6-dehydratase [Candidatus Bathyarchaeia archaeon]